MSCGYCSIEKPIANRGSISAFSCTMLETVAPIGPRPSSPRKAASDSTLPVA